MVRKQSRLTTGSSGCRSGQRRAESDDPLGVSLDRETTAHSDWGDASVRVDVSQRISGYHAGTATTVTLDEQSVFDETWTWTPNA